MNGHRNLRQVLLGVALLASIGALLSLVWLKALSNNRLPSAADATVATPTTPEFESTTDKPRRMNPVLPRSNDKLPAAVPSVPTPEQPRQPETKQGETLEPEEPAVTDPEVQRLLRLVAQGVYPFPDRTEPNPLLTVADIVNVGTGIATKPSPFDPQNFAPLGAIAPRLENRGINELRDWSEAEIPTTATFGIYELHITPGTTRFTGGFLEPSLFLANVNWRCLEALVDPAIASKTKAADWPQNIPRFTLPYTPFEERMRAKKLDLNSGEAIRRPNLDFKSWIAVEGPWEVLSSSEVSSKEMLTTKYGNGYVHVFQTRSDHLLLRPISCCFIYKDSRGFLHVLDPGEGARVFHAPWPSAK